MSYRTLPSILVGLCVAFSAAAQEKALVDRDDLAAFVDGFVQSRMESEHVVGATVSVVHRGEKIFARGYGHEDLAADQAVDADRTLFRPGSISKTFTWTAVMQLYEQGRLDLHADIRRYLPDVQIPETFQEPITLAHLMAHTPGFEESAMGHLFTDNPLEVPPLEDYLRLYQPERVRPPGVLPAYSNYGAALAGQIVANVAGMPWEDYVEQHLFEPLDMTRSTFREPWGPQRHDPLAKELADDMSLGYVYEAGAFEAAEFEFIGHIGPAGALATTATDMARWMLAHLNHGRLGDARIMTTDTARLMHTQHHTVHPEMPGLAHGFIESRIEGYRAIGHGGGTVHFVSDMQMIPELDLGVFISTNTAVGGGALVEDFVRMLVARYFPSGPHLIEPEPEAEAGRPLTAYAGTYLATRRAYTTVERMLHSPGATVEPAGGGALLVALPDRHWRLEPLGGDDFRVADTGELVKFASGRDGAISAMLVPIPILVMEKVGPLGDPNVLYGILALAAVIMACAVVGAWLRRHRPPPQTPAEAWAGRVAVVTAVAWLTVYATALVGLAPILESFASVFYDFPTPAFVAALVLALVAAVLTVASAVLLYPVWSRGNWPVWRRIRHTVVVLAALTTLLVLRNFNAIGFNYLTL